jgi:membrane protein
MLERVPGMAYYGMLSLFPMLLIASAVIRFVAGSDAPVDIAAYARDEGASGTLSATIRSAAETAQSGSLETAGTAGVIGFVTLVYGASRAFTAAGRALDVVAHRASRKRSIGRRAQDLAWTLMVLVMVCVMLLLTALSGHVVAQIAGLVGLEGHGVWLLVRWPALAVTGLLIVAVVRWSAPTGARPAFRVLTPGTVLSVGALLVATRLFDVYVTTIASYNDTYGVFAGAIILILWLWLAGTAFLLGAELDAVLHEPDAPPERGDPAP